MGGRARCAAGLLATSWIVACAGGSAPEKPDPTAWDPDGGTSATSTSGVADGSGDDEAGDDSAPPDLGTCSDDADCALPAGLCWNTDGACVGGSCMHTAAPAGDGCDDADPCTEDDVCDGAGGCIGNELDCAAPHALRGACSDGACGRGECEAGWGDCNVDWADGCETSLASVTDCGSCDTPCDAGEHATADCSSGTCAAACEEPWQDCDRDPSNGCEIPVGVANQCDAGGLNAQTGCWTAWCGQSDLPEAANFGTWFCFECSTCHAPAGGMCQWCDHATGTWYAAEACACGSYEDLACTP